MKLVIHNGSRVWGGNEKWLSILAAGLVERGHEVIVSCRARGVVARRLAAAGIATTPVRPRGGMDLMRARGFRRWLAEERPDALLLTSWNRIFWGAWAGSKARVPRVVVRLGIVRSLPPRGFQTRAFRWVHALIVNSRAIRDEWLRSAPWFRADEVHVILNAIVPSTARGGVSIRDILAVGGEVPVVAVAGHVTVRKGFDLAIRALALLPDSAQLAIIGSGPAEPELRELAASLGVGKRVHWLGHRDDVPELLRGCNAFVLASRNEGMANVMLEAMAVGTPVAATRISGVEEAIGATDRAPPAGWIVPPEDYEAMGRTLAQILERSDSARAEVAARTAEASRRIREWFSVTRMVNEAEEVLFPKASTIDP